MITPWMLLAVVALMVVGVLAADRHLGHRRAVRLRRLAERCGFRYSRVDRFALARRVGPHLPEAADDIIVRDLMYRGDPAGYDYTFTALYDGDKRGHAVLHARERCGECELFDVRQADPRLPLGEQYRRLLHEATPTEHLDGLTP